MLTLQFPNTDFQKRFSLQISSGRPRCDRGQRWCGQYCQVTLNFCNICNNVANVVVNVIRLSSGEKLGVLSQGPGIVYDVKMVGLKVFATAGSKVTVQDIRISRGFREKVNSMISIICKISMGADHCC